MKTINSLRDYLLENYVDEDGDLDICGLDFSEFSGDIYVNRMKVKGTLYQRQYEVEGDLYQSYHEVEGNLLQSNHDVKGYLIQSNHEVKGNLSQGDHDVKGNYYSTNISVTGAIRFEEPRKALKEITAEELEKKGYKFKEEVK